jgi:hypothetical protein
MGCKHVRSWLEAAVPCAWVATSRTTHLLSGFDRQQHAGMLVGSPYRGPFLSDV